MAGKSIHIKPSHKGLFTAEAKAHGETVQQYADSVLSNPKASPALKKRAQFAKNAKKFNNG